MNTKSSMTPVRNLALAAVIILSASCLDYTVKTSVNKDGSIFRQYTVRGDSTEIFDGSLRIPAGDPWHTEHLYDHKEKEDTTSEKSQYIYQASRTFSSVKELNDWLNADTSSEKVSVRVDLHKKFRWFYTYYEYSEVFPMSFPFNKIPVDRFLTELEQSIVRDDGKTVYSPASGTMIWKKDTAAYQYSPADSAVMKKITQTCEEKLVRWMTASFVEEFTSLLESDFPDHPATKAIRQKSDQFAEAIFRKVPLASIDTLDVAMLVSTGDSLIQSNTLEEIYTSNPLAFMPVKNKVEQLERIENDDSYHQQLNMPGTVFLSNADEISDGLMQWEFGPEFFLMKDYEMKASSRAPNYWIMLLTGIAALFMTGILIMKHKR